MLAPRLTRLAIAAFVAVGASTLMTARVAATPPGAPGLIAIGCEAGLWTVQADGENLQLVTEAEVIQPDWSPAGTMIAFTRYTEPTKSAVWVMNADGSAAAQRTSATGESGEATWRPDAEQILYSHKSSGFRMIRSVEPTPPSSSGAAFYPPFSVHDPAVSPSDVFGVLMVGAEAGGPQRIWQTTDAAYEVSATVVPPAGSFDAAPDWAPTGSRFAFVRDDGTTRSIHAVDLDGSDLLRLTDETIDAISPTYAADGGRIAYLSRPAAEAGTDAPFDLWTMDHDGGNKTLVLAEVACDHIDWQPVRDFPLVDTRFGKYESAIRWAYFEGIVSGCAPERFCETHSVTRAQVATFLARALDLPDATEDHFGDDDGTTHEDDINRMAEAGLASGCGPDRYCPTLRLTRAEMASLMARALELPAASIDHFDDDDGQTHEANINRMAEAALTSGCGERLFCPRRVLSRGEAMALVHRAFGP